MNSNIKQNNKLNNAYLLIFIAGIVILIGVGLSFFSRSNGKDVVNQNENLTFDYKVGKMKLKYDVSVLSYEKSLNFSHYVYGETTGSRVKIKIDNKSSDNLFGLCIQYYLLDENDHELDSSTNSASELILTTTSDDESLKNGIIQDEIKSKTSEEGYIYFHDEGQNAAKLKICSMTKFDENGNSYSYEYDKCKIINFE